VAVVGSEPAVEQVIMASRRSVLASFASASVVLATGPVVAQPIVVGAALTSGGVSQSGGHVYSFGVPLAGRVVAGTATLDAGIVVLMEQGATGPCIADFNQDGGVDGTDVVDFFVAWEAGETDADVNRDGGTDGSDLREFFSVWEAGGC
jgi:hypothetical protein